MGLQERIYRMLMLAYPREHRREYGDAMVQLMRDRLRDDGGGLSTALVWGALLVDLTRSATIERMAVVRAEFRTGWWRTASVLVAAVMAVLAIRALLEPATGPWYQYTVGRLVLTAAPVAIVTGLVIRTRHRWQGSALVALGLLPGAGAIVLFWYPPALMFGFFSIAVMAGASIDADNARRATFTAPRSLAAVLPATDWSAPADHSREGPA